MSDEFDLSDAEGIDYGSDEGVEHVVVQDGDESVVYTGGTECSYCPRESTGVVVSKTDDGRTLHRPVCEKCLAELEDDDSAMDFEFKPYD